MKKVYGKVYSDYAVLSNSETEVDWLSDSLPDEENFRYISRGYKRPRDVVRRVTETALKMGWEIEWVK